MKKILAWFLALATWLLIAASLEVFGAEVPLQWDAAPAGSWDLVRIYEKTADGTYVKVAEVAGTQTTARITGVAVGRHIYVARGMKGLLESANSNEVTGEISDNPKNLRILATLTVQIVHEMGGAPRTDDATK